MNRAVDGLFPVPAALPGYRLRTSVLALAMALSAPAWAGNGGAGGITPAGNLAFTGAGGITGNTAQAQGADAVVGGPGADGGGGGGTDVTTGFGGSGGMSVAGGASNLAPRSATGQAGAIGSAIVTGTVSGQNGANAVLPVPSTNNGGGAGGGGVGVTTGVDLDVVIGASVTGGAGGNSVSSSSGGAAGGGGSGVFSTANVNVAAGASIRGGNGGSNVVLGGGGGGGIGVIVGGAGTLTNAGAVTGGNGGNARNTGANSGQGGFGGEGVWISDGGALVNSAGGVIAGGAAATVTGSRFSEPTGGVGVVGNNATIVNAGTISGGANRAPGTIANAVQFIGGVNALELRAGSTINGNVVAFSVADTLKLGGNADASFDVSTVGATAQYQGFGFFEKTGASTWNLTGTSTQTMPWTVSQGVLAVDGLLSNSAFIVNSGATLAVGGAIADSVIAPTSGTVNVAAGGSVSNSPFFLNGDSTLTVAGSVDASPVTANASVVTVASSGSVADSPFTLNGSTLTVAGAIQNSPVALNGGSANITGTAISSPFTVGNGGVLTVNGSAGTSSVTVDSGTLRGAGTVGATTLRSGAVVAPGNSIGTLNVNGAYVQQSGAVYQAEVDPTSSASDRIAVTGTATIQDGAVLNVTKTSPAPYVAGTRYTVLSATDGVNGTYTLTGDTSLSSFLSLAGTYDPRNAYLEVKQTRSIADVAITPNQGAVASGLDSLAPGAPAAVPVLNQQTDAAARTALDQLSGEIHASVQSAMLESSHFTRDAVSERLGDTFTCTAEPAADPRGVASGQVAGASACGGARPTGWARFYGNWGHADGDGNAARLDRSVGGFFIGADMPVAGTWRAGVLAGYSHGSYRVNGSGASADSDDYHLGVYGGTQWGALGLRTGATYTWHDISADRRLAVPGFADRLSSNYNAGTAQIFGELGYKVPLGNRANVEPFLNLAYVNQHAEGFDERGGADALHVASQDMDTGFSTLGLRGTSHFTFNGTDFLLKGMVGWRYAVGDVRPVATESFQGGSSFDISGAPIARNQAVVDVGVGVHITRNATISLSYNGQYSSRNTDQGVLGALNIAF
uniref:autotransporter outer membrane beta-barrel domain-containing protein n=1 Tax=Bordetella sputigena TaxID=1416810 RepID=UPI0039EDF1B9